MSKETYQEFTKELQGLQHTTKDHELLLTLWQCLEMIEKYHYQVFIKPAGAVIHLQNDDSRVWMNTYFPQLVETNRILDYQFYDPSGKKRHLGIGNDSCFIRDEYINFRYQLYRTLYSYYQPFLKAAANDPLQRLVMECLQMMEPYSKSFQENISKRHELILFQGEDKARWLKLYFPVLVESTLMMDYTITDPIALRKSYGIGDDAITSGSDLQHFACECYRFLLVPIHAMESLMQRSV